MKKSQSGFRWVLVFLVVAVIAGVGWVVKDRFIQEPTFGSDVPTVEPSHETSALVENVVATELVDEATPDQPPNEPEGTIVVMAADSIPLLDPYRLTGSPLERSIAAHLWNSLTYLDDNLSVDPQLAASWRLVNNFTWEFKLRQDVTFHNGEKFNAEAVRFSVERSQTLPGSLETFATDVDLADVEIVDDFTVRFSTKQPIADLPYYASFLEILPPNYYSQADADALDTMPVGSGPYQIGILNQGEQVSLDAYRAYWQGMPAYAQIVFRQMPSPEDRFSALSDGTAMLVTDLPPISTENWNISGSRLATIESTQRLFVGINGTGTSPLADVRVRQALNYGVDVSRIVDDLLAGYGERYGSWVTPPAADPALKPWPYDPDLALQLLREAGYTTGFTTTLTTPIGLYDQDAAVAQAIADQLGEIGITITIEPMEWTLYLRQLLSDQKPPLFLLALNSYGNGLEDIRNLTAEFPFNPTSWRNDQFEVTVKRAINTHEDAARTRRLNEAQTIAYQEAPLIWLWRTYDFYGVNNTLDWTPRPDGLVYLYKKIPAGNEGSQ